MRIPVLSLYGGKPQESCGFCSEGLTGQKRAERPLTSLATAREQFEKEYILSVLERVDGSRTTGAKILGISRKALWEKCKRYGIPSAREEARTKGVGSGQVPFLLAERAR